MRLIEHNALVRLYWDDRQWIIDSPDGRLCLGDCSVEEAVEEFSAATKRATCAQQEVAPITWLA